jgi:isoamylase
VSYEHKHNEANQENNRDGADRNLSTNCGVEGPTDDANIVAMRRRLRRNFLSSLLLAQGVPLLLAGDEVGNSQSGNNNTYCQDNETGWVDWSGLGRDGEDMTALIGQLTKLRQRYPQIQGHQWLKGRRADETHDVVWLTPEAAEMTEEDWRFPNGHFLAYVLAPIGRGKTAVLVVINAAPDAIEFTLPDFPEGSTWTRVHDTTSETLGRRAIPAGTRFTAPERSVLVFSGAVPRGARLWRRSKSPTPPRARPGSGGGRRT